MGYLLFIVYLVLLSWLLTRIRFIKNGGLSSTIIIVLFLIKVGTGVFGGRLSEFKKDSDSWTYHRESIQEYQLLFSKPAEYFSNLFHSGYTDGHGGYLRFKDSYWNDLKNNLVIKLFSILDIFSGGNYYVNVILFNFLIFFGHFALFRVFKKAYNGLNTPIVITVFLLPSVVFFGSALHKEGLILAATGIILYNTDYCLHTRRFNISKVLFAMAALSFIFLLRNYVIMAMLPALFAWIITVLKKYPAFITFVLVYIFAAVVFFNIQYIYPPVNLAKSVVEKQADFLTLEHGNTFIGVPLLSPNFTSFLWAAPQAIAHLLFRPCLTDISLSRLLFPVSLELFFYEILFILFLLFRKKNLHFDTPFTLFTLFFSISVLLLIGYIVPVIGAFVRYRSIFLPFLITPLICYTDWQKIQKWLRIKKPSMF